MVAPHTQQRGPRHDRNRHVIAIALTRAPSPSQVLLVEELKLGRELFEWVGARRGTSGDSAPLGTAAIVRLVSELLCGLRHLHEYGVLHRDLKVRPSTWHRNVPTR